METVKFDLDIKKLGLVFPAPEYDEDEPAPELTERQRVVEGILKMLRREVHSYEHRQHQRSVTLTADNLIAKEGVQE